MLLLLRKTNLPLVEEGAPSKNTQVVFEKTKNFVIGPKPRITVLARTSNNLLLFEFMVAVNMHTICKALV
jgi:hypothetical protein